LGNAAAPTSPTTSQERKGPVLEVLRELLSAGQADAIVELFQKLVSRNTELEKRLMDLLARRHKNEGVSTAQLLLCNRPVRDALRGLSCCRRPLRS
jgi:hypothetical protein